MQLPTVWCGKDRFAMHLQGVCDGFRGAAEVVTEHSTQQHARGNELLCSSAIAISDGTLLFAGIQTLARDGVWKRDSNICCSICQLWQGFRGEAEMGKQRGAIDRQAASFCAGAPIQWVS